MYHITQNITLLYSCTNGITTFAQWHKVCYTVNSRSFALWLTWGCQICPNIPTKNGSKQASVNIIIAYLVHPICTQENVGIRAFKRLSNYYYSYVLVNTLLFESNYSLLAITRIIHRISYSRFPCRPIPQIIGSLLYV